MSVRAVKRCPHCGRELSNPEIKEVTTGDGTVKTKACIWCGGGLD